MYREALQRSVIDLIEPLLSNQGFDLVELQLQQRKGRWLVRIFADTVGGISLDDCRRLSSEIGQVLDAEDLIPSAYVLEVSSPGLDRPLRTSQDFRRQCQRLVTIFLRSCSAESVQQLTGRITVVTDENLVLHMPPDTPLIVPFSDIDHGVVELEFK
jgi:ribosome maturation factor RimP